MVADVGVTSQLHHRQLLRGMRMVFFGVAVLPPQVLGSALDSFGSFSLGSSSSAVFMAVSQSC